MEPSTSSSSKPSISSLHPDTQRKSARPYFLDLNMIILGVIVQRRDTATQIVSNHSISRRLQQKKQHFLIISRMKEAIASEYYTNWLKFYRKS